jgi:tRNA1Val (adenine37-N6)-methyltransferase
LLAVDRLLLPNGYFATLLPFHRDEAFKTMALGKGYYLHHAMTVKQTPQHNYFRSMLLFGRKEVPPMQSGIVIRENGLYTNGFRQLLKDYYLHLT